MTDGPENELADTLAALGRRVGQAMSGAFERLRPAVDALADVPNRPEVRSVLEQAERFMRHRPCLCPCWREHPDDRGICETFDAVISGQFSTEWLGDFGLPLCAPCAAARAAREFADS